MTIEESQKRLRSDFELPLLKILIEMGGSANMTDENLYNGVATKMRLTEAERSFDARHARPKWAYELQWVRYNLVRKGEMESPKRGVWQITAEGRKRVRRETRG